MKKTTQSGRIQPKKENFYSEQEMKRYLGALAETHNEHLKGIKEGFEIVNKKLDNHTEMIGSLMEDVSVLKSDMAMVKEDISVIKDDLKQKVGYNEFDKRVGKLEEKI